MLKHFKRRLSAVILSVVLVLMAQMYVGISLLMSGVSLLVAALATRRAIANQTNSREPTSIS